MRVSILIADNFSVVRRGLRDLLEAQPEWKVVGEANNGRDAIAQAKKLRPDVVILDVNLHRINGLDAARLILKAVPRTRILIFAANHSKQMLEKALHAGVRGYVLKSDAAAGLVPAVTALINDRPFFPSAPADAPVKQLNRKMAGPAPPRLTAREVEIIRLLAEGKSNKEGATILGISSRTVENHRAKIMKRLGLNSFSDLVRYAVRNGIIEP